MASIAPRIEDRGIDEIYIDLGEHVEDSLALARRIQEAVFSATGLTCSIGISPNKLLSKIGSDLNKPSGITILTQDDIAARIWPLAVKKINGIGPKASERLDKLGIHTIGELARTAPELLITHFGHLTGRWMSQVAHGIDERPIVVESEPKSISRESTFERDLHAQQDKPELSDIFTSLCMRLADDLNRRGYACRTVGIKLRYADFRSVTRDITLRHSVSDGKRIRQAAGECLKRVPLQRKIRLLGVRASSLVPINEVAKESAPSQAELPF